MHALRSTTELARLVLAWFVLALGVAMLSPVLQPQAMELVCSDAGRMKLVLVGADGDAAPAAHPTLDCAACLAVLPPPAGMQPQLPRPPQADARPVFFAAAPATAPAGAALPPRGPPARA